jgi:nitrogen regulatory protein PII
MKKIEAVILPEKLEDVMDALSGLDAPDHGDAIEGHGKQKG